MSIKILAWNSQSLKPKIPELSRLIEKNKFNIILISETWLNEKIEIKIPNFHCYRNDRPPTSRFPHGGVAILIHKSIEHKLIKKCKLEYIESIFIKITNFSNFITIGSVYAPPSIPFQKFKNDITKLLSLTGPSVIAGD